jgi:hypothetical protein
MEMEARVQGRAGGHSFLFGRDEWMAVGSKAMAMIDWAELWPRRDGEFPAQAQVVAWARGNGRERRVLGHGPRLWAATAGCWAGLCCTVLGHRWRVHAGGLRWATRASRPSA